MIDVVRIGSAYIALVMVTDDYPDEDGKLQCTVTLLQGGSPCNALVSVAKLGCTAAYMGAVGDETHSGAPYARQVKCYGVDTSHVRLPEGKKHLPMPWYFSIPGLVLVPAFGVKYD